MTDAREVRALLDDRPNLEPALESLLETDANHETWTFDDAGVDSGSFGALVDEGVVEKVDGEYRLADPDAVERGLAGEVESGDGSGTSLSLSLPEFDIDPRVAAALTGALALVFVFRVLAFDAIFRSGRVVLSSNDPYFYLYWTEELSRQSNGVLDLSALTAGSFGLLKSEPLLVAVLWVATELVGGIEQAPLVLAWYPVVAGVATGVFTYLFATGLTDDERVGIASVVMLAVLPVLAFRSGIGFADHHAFDYVWLAMTAAAAVRLARTPATRSSVRSQRTLGWALVMGVGIAGQVLAWEAGPLLLFPLGLYAPLAALVSLERGDSTALALAPVAAGAAVAGLLTAAIHLLLGWQTDVVAFSPLLLAGGVVGVAGIGEAVRRAPTLPVSEVRALAALEAAGFVTGLGLLVVVLPAYGDRLFSQLGRIGTRSEIVEGQSLFSTQTFGWLFLFGLLLFLAIPYMGLALVRAAGADQATERRGWLLGGSYAWLFLVLTLFQIRFAGEFSTFVAAFAGFGFVHIAERVDLARPPVPFRDATAVRSDGGGQESPIGIPSARGALSLVFLFLLISGLSIAQAPVKANQVPIDEHKFETAVWIDGYAAENDIEYPENYVFSPWSRNRMYNYFVNGESRSYGFAFSDYETFLRSTDPDIWYERLRERNRDGFIVFNRQEAEDATLQTRLTRGLGGRYNGFDGSGHYRALYVTDRHQVHQVVPGGNLTGEVENETGPVSNATVRLSTTVSVSGQEAEATYIRQARTDDDGRYQLRVAYPGEYEVSVRKSNTTATVTVPEAAIENGERVDAGTLDTAGSSGTTNGNQTRLRRPAYQVSPS